ncbi:DUF3515 family protein [Nocardioides zeae]|uniref:DUF3515 family protein n=1 Tax=Nocardioides imazamoxiresistens TaxID=3231893 RepID=A0ABU3PYQ9_9ACTN|nr:DUF3515 family protein [Nocardioides zeae]MDT9593910.1 DUF3515 family protein [Nocardioides zeae]
MRPSTRRTRCALGVPLSAALLVLTACGAGTVTVEGAAQLEDLGAAEEACTGLLDALPDELGGQETRDVEPAGVAAQAWGDPVVVLVCGAEMPLAFGPTSPCDVVEEVQWYVDERSALDPAADVVLTTIGYEPVVQVRIPARLRPPADEMVALAPAIRENAELVESCT